MQRRTAHSMESKGLPCDDQPNGFAITRHLYQDPR